MTTSCASSPVSISTNQSRMKCSGFDCSNCQIDEAVNGCGLGCGANTSPVPTLFVSNAFSLSMMDEGDYFMCLEHLLVVQLDDQQARELLELANNKGYQAVSSVGHADTARVFSDILGTEVPMNRTSVQLRTDDALLVGQYSGPRLPEGATRLPEGAKIKWYLLRKEDTHWEEFHQEWVPGKGTQPGYYKEPIFPNGVEYRGHKPYRPFSPTQFDTLLK